VETLKMNKYQRLSERLSRHPRDQWRASFAELEQVLGFTLPKSAWERSSWWSNETMTDRSQKLAWINEGWRVEDVDQDSGVVTFRRNGSSPAAARPSRPRAPAAKTIIEAAPPVRAPIRAAPPSDVRVVQALGLAVVAAGGAALGALMAQGLWRRA
jgi:hypothetical protein